jgi:bifunctional non-homologous end joining protein LigD
MLESMFPAIQPMPLVRQHGPFSHPDWLFEIKHDGFRALAYIERGTARLLSRNGNWFKSFPVLCDSLASDLSVRSAVIDGEIVCFDRPW